jgi:hypothetical protein
MIPADDVLGQRLHRDAHFNELVDHRASNCCDVARLVGGLLQPLADLAQLVLVALGREHPGHELAGERAVFLVALHERPRVLLE